MNTRIAVPIASAVSFWAMVGDDIAVPPPVPMGWPDQPAGLTYGASSAARAARASSASGPSAARVISDDGRIVRPSRAMRLLASASRPSWRMTIRLANRLAAWTNRAAGRAWSPDGSMTMEAELGHRSRSAAAWPSSPRRRRPRRPRRSRRRRSPGRRRGSRPRRAGASLIRIRARSAASKVLERELEAERRAAEVEQHERLARRPRRASTGWPRRCAARSCPGDRPRSRRRSATGTSSPATWATMSRRPSTSVPLWETRTRPTNRASFRCPRCSDVARCSARTRQEPSKSGSKRCEEASSGCRRGRFDRCRAVTALLHSADRDARRPLRPSRPPDRRRHRRRRGPRRAGPLPARRRTPRRVPDPARRRPRRRRPRRQPRDRLPRRRRAPRGAARRHAARRAAAGRRPPARRGGRRRVRAALRHRLPRGRRADRRRPDRRRRGRCRRCSRRPPTGWRGAAAARSATRRSSTRSRPPPTASSARSQPALDPARAYAAAVRDAARGMRSTRPLVARRGLALRLGDRSVGHLDPGRRVVPAPAARLGGD